MNVRMRIQIFIDQDFTPGEAFHSKFFSTMKVVDGLLRTTDERLRIRPRVSSPSPTPMLRLRVCATCLDGAHPFARIPFAFGS